MKKRNERSPGGDRRSSGPRKPASGAGPRRSAGPRGPRTERDEEPRGTRGARPGPRPASRDERDRGPRERPSGDRPYRKAADRSEPSRGAGRGPARPSRERDERSERPRRDTGRGPARPGSGPYRGPRTEGPDRPARGARAGAEKPQKPWGRQSRDERTFKEGDPLTRRPFRRGERSNRFSLPNPANEGLVRLNRYLAQAGVGSRREADALITTGVVTVNGKVVTELGTKVLPTDVVHFGEQKLSMEQKRYVLLNKPKDTITTTDDPNERHTVMDLIAKACTERLYPVGRLDRQTTGVLLLTNDGDLAKKLTHPSHGAEKLYHVTLDKTVQAAHLRELVDGVHLDDGIAQADEASYVAGAESRREVGIKLHMGRNRIVRRMFEALGYEVLKLDRVMFAGLTKKDLQRSHWRHLSEKEVVLLKRTKEAPKSTKEERGGKRLRRSHGSE